MIFLSKQNVEAISQSTFTLAFIRHKPGPPRYAWSTILVISLPNQTNMLLNNPTDYQVF